MTNDLDYTVVDVLAARAAEAAEKAAHPLPPASVIVNKITVFQNEVNVDGDYVTRVLMQFNVLGVESVAGADLEKIIVIDGPSPTPLGTVDAVKIGEAKDTLLAQIKSEYSIQ